MELAPEVYSVCDAAERRRGGKVSGRAARAQRSACIAEIRRGRTRTLAT